MGWSVTGNILSGSVQRPDILTGVGIKGNAYSHDIAYDSINCKLNICGYIPGVSTITGLSRALLGLVHTIVHLVCAIFSSNRTHHLQEAKLGMKNIGRGLVEATPIIGNIATFIVDKIRTNKFHEQTSEVISRNKAVYYNQVALFSYGQEIAKRSIEECDAELAKLNGKHTDADIVRIIRNQG